MNVHFWNTLKKTLTNQLSDKSGSHHFPQTNVFLTNNLYRSKLL